MEEILEIVNDQYDNAMWIGSNQTYRNLNHGVCSGLIVLKALSFFYDFVYGFEKFDTWDKYSKKYKEMKKQGSLNKVDKVSKQSYDYTKSFFTEKFLPEQIKKRYGPGGRQADFWFNKVLWATASVAIHDVIQEDYYEKICKKRRGVSKNLTIELSEDPLAFLGVLVDVLQEWDRYTVSGESAFSDKQLLQSDEVYIIEKGKTNFYYPKRNEKNLDDKIKTSLKRCLDKWDEVIDVLNVDMIIQLEGGTLLPNNKIQLRNGRIGYDYNENLTARGGSGKYTWIAEKLPDGLVIKEETGVVSGRPTKSGNFIGVVTVKDLNYPYWVSNKEYTVTIN